MNIKIDSGVAYIQVPFNREFIKKIKRCRTARWNQTQCAWVLNAEYMPVVREILLDVFGENDLMEARHYDVKLTFHKDFCKTGYEIAFFGRSLAYPVGFDGTAKAGKQVRYLAGGCFSDANFDGVPKNRKITIKAGSVVEVYNVPEALIHREPRIENVDFELVEYALEKVS